MCSFLIFVFLLLLLTFASFFSAAETALTVASRPKIHRLAKKGIEKAKIADNLQRSSGSVISSLIAGNNMILHIVSFLVGSWASNLKTSSQTIVLLCTSIFILLYSEVLPKMIAIHYAENILLESALALKKILFVFKPISNILHFLANGVLKLFKVKQTTSEEKFEELRGFIDLYTQAYPTEERIMLTSILDLAKVRVKDILIHKQTVQMINADCGYDELIRVIKSTPYTRLPVWQYSNDNIVGILNIKSIIDYIISDKNSQFFKLIEHIAQPWFIPESTDLLEQLHAFKFRHEHIAVVVDEYGAFTGIVTLEDLLEEIVGDINDESDIKMGAVLKCTDGTFLIPGTYAIRDLNRQFNWELPSEEAPTVAGLLLKTAQDIPNIGEIYEINNVRFEIVQKHQHFLTLIKVYTR